MKKNDILTNAFFERLVAVYGNEEAAFQQERYLKLAESFEKDFSEKTVKKEYIFLLLVLLQHMQGKRQLEQVKQ